MWIIPNWNMIHSFLNNEAWKEIFLDLCLFKKKLFNTMFPCNFSIPFPPICIPIFFSIEFNFNPLVCFSFFSFFFRDFVQALVTQHPPMHHPKNPIMGFHGWDETIPPRVNFFGWQFFFPSYAFLGFFFFFFPNLLFFLLALLGNLFSSCHT